MIITFEGVDGSGKTTVATKLYSVLRNKGYKVHYYKEDLVDEFSLSIRKILTSSNVDLETKTFLFFALRANLIKNYLVNLDNDDIVLLDRFVDSTIVYDSLLERIPIQLIQDVNSYLLNKYKITIDYTVIVDCDTEVVKERMKMKRTQYLYDSDSEETIQQVRNLFLSLPSMFQDRKYIVLDNSTEDQLTKNVIFLTELVTKKQN